MIMKVLERDWRLYKERIADWQERHIGNLLEEYRKIIDSDLENSEKFWEIYDRIRDDKRSEGVMCERKRANMIEVIEALMIQGIIKPEDLDGFSEELKNEVEMFTSRFSANR